MSDESTIEVRRFFAAMADEDRLRIAGRLALGSAHPTDLAVELGMREPVLARHLAVLAEVSVVRRTPGGEFELDVQSLRQQRKRLLTRDRAPSPADEPGTPEWEQVVLRNFFDGETLKTIPADLGKRTVVLDWLANRFELDTRYPEREVNEIIKRHHPDASALRRELVDRRFMTRENGLYWRLMRGQG